MSNNSENLHVYDRVIDTAQRNSLSVLSDFITPESVVLDLGCGSGALGRHLIKYKSCTVDGITYNEKEAQQAIKNYREVYVADLDRTDLQDFFPDKKYDFIICADVLEHLKNPEKILEQAKLLLKFSGKLLISIPNANYCGLIAELMNGKFNYREEGLLDKTHLRFYTRSTLLSFLEKNGWVTTDFEEVEVPLNASEFKVDFDLLPPSVSRYLLAIPDALTYQFIISASCQNVSNKTDSEISKNNFLLERKPIFTSQVYFDYSNGFSEDKKNVAHGFIGEPHQEVVFNIPNSEDPIKNIRFDPADRPGYLYLYEMSFESDNGLKVWSWEPTSHGLDEIFTHLNEIIISTPYVDSKSRILLLTGDDPWLKFSVPDSIKNHLPGKLKVVVGWPMSSDYLAAVKEFREIENKYYEKQYLLEHENIKNSELIHELKVQISSINKDKCDSEDLILALKNNLLLETKERVSYQNKSVELELNNGALKDYLDDIHQSRLFKATRPISSMKMKFDRFFSKNHQPKLQNSLKPIERENYPVNIIVPVYKGLSDTKNCIESVLSSNTLSAWRLIVINDASPEPEVTSWLREIAQNEPRLELYENIENLGFVGTVNRGMSLSRTDDVLLLNSDTVVANDWLDRIRNAAYSNENIGSVTPFSTNATICSYPKFCEDNPLPFGLDTASMDKLCAEVNSGKYVEVPTGVGFCMYIRRKCLDQVGLFDTENFGKGYGEENDFCQRAIKAGWKNIHLLDTFVLHTGGVSFGDSKSPREQAAMETMRRLHPRYEADVMNFVRNDPAKHARLALDIARIQKSSKEAPVILNVLHNRGGGTLHHVQELAQILEKKAIFLNLIPAPGGNLIIKRVDPNEAFELIFDINSEFNDLIRILKSLGVAHVHYHHLMDHDKKVFDIANILNVSYDFTAHDYFTFCRNITLTDSKNVYSHPDPLGRCACCEANAPSDFGTTINGWREINKKLLIGARNIIAPSVFTQKIISSFVPKLNVRAIAHPDIKAALPSLKVNNLGNEQSLKVLIIGALSGIKGADILEDVAIAAAKQSIAVEFHLLGYAYRNLKKLPQANLIVYGAYDEKDLPILIKKIDPHVAWFPAQAPETYSYTLSAALQAGLPVVATDIGAFPERLSGRQWSWVMPHSTSTENWLKFFIQIREENFLLKKFLLASEKQDQAESGTEFYKNIYLNNIYPRIDEISQIHVGDLMNFSKKNTMNVVNSKALNMLIHLRSMPFLRTFSKLIPSSFQRKVKSWLLK